jgi:hypothetical protein
VLWRYVQGFRLYLAPFKKTVREQTRGSRPRPFPSLPRRRGGYCQQTLDLFTHTTDAVAVLRSGNKVDWSSLPRNEAYGAVSQSRAHHDTRTIKGRSPLRNWASRAVIKTTTYPDLKIEGEREEDKKIEPITSDMRRDRLAGSLQAGQASGIAIASERTIKGRSPGSTMSHGRPFPIFHFKKNRNKSVPEGRHIGRKTIIINWRAVRYAMCSANMASIGTIRIFQMRK